MRKRLSRTTKYLLVICAFLFVVTASLGFALTKQSSRAMRTLIENRMLDVSNTAAAMLDGDTLERLGADDKQTADYQNAFKILTCFEENIELEYIYCIRDLKDGNFVFLIDPDAVEPGEFGEHIPYTDALFQASLGTPSVDQVPYQDNWGRFYSAYSPVFDSSHQVAGIVAVDFSADWYEKQIRNQVQTTLLICAVSLFFAGVVIALIAARFRKQFHHMLNEMNVISDGIETLVHELSPALTVNLSKEPSVSSGDEISELSNRIQSLEHQLGEEIAYVRAQAYVDSLTGLGNRTAYEGHVAQLEEEIRRETARFALAVFDLNGIKEINDHLGHEQGDRAIAAVGNALKQVFEEAGLYRIGGDEFVVILDGSCPDLGSRLESLSQTLANQGSVSVSKGCTVFLPGEDRSYQTVFKRADAAMYDDKREYYRTHGDRRRH